MNKKRFFRNALIYFIAFVVILVPVNLLFAKVGETRIFSGVENLMNDLDYRVDPDSPFFSKYKDSNRVNVLLLGLNGELSDTIMLASYDLKNQKVDVISIPRDTYYLRKEYKGAAAQKINAIYHSDGAVGTAQAVSDVLLGMPVHYYVVVEYDDVEKIVDAIGGVPIDIPFHMHYEDKYDKPPLYIDFPEGHRVLNGEEAVKFLRFRKGSNGYKGYPEGDIGRVKAQQEFIKSAFQESLGFGLPKVAKTVLETVDSDLTIDIALKIAKKAVRLQGEDIATYMVPGESGTHNGASYWYADEKAVVDLIDQIYGGNTGGEETQEPENDN